MEKIKSQLIKPLDGKQEGEIVELSKADFDRLAAKNAVIAVGGVVKAKEANAPENKAAPVHTNKAKARK